jgi:hypothetical protein
MNGKEDGDNGPKVRRRALSPPGTMLYGADLLIHDRSLLASLCVFYEHIRLPYAQVLDPTTASGANLAGLPMRVVAQHIRATVHPDVDGRYAKCDRLEGESLNVLKTYVVLRHFEETTACLFESGALSRLHTRGGLLDLTQLDALRPTFQTWRNTTPLNQDDAAPGMAIPVAALDLMIHLTRCDLIHPGIFVYPRSRVPIETAKAFLAARTIGGYLLPKLRSLMPEQILSLRERVADTREGFSLYLQQLTSLMSLVNDEAHDIRKIKREAKYIVDQRLMPLFYEFERQCKTRRDKRLAMAVDETAKAFTVGALLAAPLACFGIGRGLAANARLLAESRLEGSTNERHALNFMLSVAKYSDSVAD